MMKPLLASKAVNKPVMIDFTGIPMCELQGV
jgi:hypothetical protein